MREVMEFLFEKLEDNWLKIIMAGVFMLVGGMLGYRRARRDLQRREFYDRINISLNSIEGGVLKVRTLAETSCEELFHNHAAAKLISQSAQKTTEDDPLLPLEKNDQWLFLNSVLNRVAQLFSSGTIQRDLGRSMQCADYLICLTCEVAPGIRQRKIRAMLIKKDVLTSLPETAPELEHPIHSIRWGTLQKLAQAYAQTPDRFISMEICG